MVNEVMDWDTAYKENGIEEMIARFGKQPEGEKFLPWNIGRPQPALQEYLDSSKVVGPVLDSGCGLGVTSIYLSMRGHDVTGIDISKTAAEKAAATAKDLCVQAKFAQGDMLNLQGYDDTFSTVVDSTVYHSVPKDGRSEYTKTLHRVTRSGAYLFVLAFNKEAFAGFGEMAGPNGFTKDELHDVISECFSVEDISPAAINVRVPRIPGTPMENMPLNAAGFGEMPGWKVVARRK